MQGWYKNYSNKKSAYGGINYHNNDSTERYVVTITSIETNKCTRSRTRQQQMTHK